MTNMNQDTSTQTKQQTRKVAGLQFSKAGKIEYFLAEDMELSQHELVVVKSEHGNSVGRVIMPPHEVPTTDIATNIKPVLRKATKEDLERHDEEMERAREGFALCSRKILERNLPMKLVDVSFEDNKAIFFFVADERIDFRALVKDMASALHTRIEMRQIGSRDGAKATGALGPCGLVCCCERFLREFSPISISMAKNQCLSPNPAKLTGMCGKLKCCLAYENEFYLNERKGLPPAGSKVKTSKGPGVVTDLNVLKRVCMVRLDIEDENNMLRFPCSECEVVSKPRHIEKEEADKEYEKIEG